MEFLLVMAVIVLVLVGAIGLLAASAAGRLDPGPASEVPSDASPAEVTSNAVTLVVGGLLAAIGIVTFLVSHDVAWLSSAGVGAIYAAKAARGLRV